MWEPFGTSSSNAAASWKSGCKERGTLSILTTCLITLTLCVYTTLHLNIPEHGKSSWFQQLKRKAWWMLVGLFAPEFVACIAFQDHIYAKDFERDMTNMLKMGPHEKRQSPWTRVHGHYALMGGFAFDPRKVDIKFFPGNRPQLTLTPGALKRIARYHEDLIPDIFEAEIKDKSKADGLAKTIVCIQALWFGAQTVGRLATHNPVSLLELNTFLHALFCFSIYAAWWHKPLDVEEPTSIDLSSNISKEMAAWMVMDSALGQHRECRSDDTSSSSIVSGQNLRLEYDEDFWATPGGPSANIVALVNRAAEYYQREGLSIDVDPTNSASLDNEGTLTLQYGQMCYGFRLVSSDIPEGLPPYQYHTFLKTSDIECLRLAQLFRKHNTNASDKAWHFSIASSNNWVVAQASVSHSSDDSLKRLHDKWPFSYLGADSSSINFYIALAAAGTVYGGLHLLAWNGPFPTRAERILWRASGFIIAVPFPTLCFLFLALILSDLTRRMEHKWLRPLPVTRLVDILVDVTTRLREKAVSFIKRRCKYYPMRLLRDVITGMEYIFGSMGNYTINSLAFSFGLMYIAARVYLIVECFINLAYLPNEAYREVEWSNLLPHFGSG